MLFRLGLLLINIGFFFSRFTLSLGMIVLVVNFIVSNDLKGRVKKFCCTNLLIFESIFLVYLLSGLHSQNMSYFLERIQIMLPFLVLPHIFFANKNFEEGVSFMVAFLCCIIFLYIWIFFFQISHSW